MYFSLMRSIFISLLTLAIIISPVLVFAHPLGNFSTNHFVRIEVSPNQVKVRYIVDMAEITSFQELQKNSFKDANNPSQSELKLYLEKIIPEYINNLSLIIDGTPIKLNSFEKAIFTPLGAGNLKTLRVECSLIGEISINGQAIHKFSFQDNNHPTRLGWHETMVKGDLGVNIFDSSLFGNSLTDEIKAYPENALLAPLNERSGNFSFTFGNIPAEGKPLLTRQGKQTVNQKDPLTELIALPNMTFTLAIWGLFIAALLGGLHALSPGHGKTIVAAYLVGSKGTIRHALFLGLTVTFTHTIGVFALGLITLFASQYIIPEKLFPILSFSSGLIVVSMGLGLGVSRLTTFLNIKLPVHNHQNTQNTHTHWHFFSDHTHDEKDTSHLPPTDGNPVTWRSLLALGISGGLLPCPSALVVLLAAIALHRIAYGLLLVITFSFGLATVLTITGLIFVYAGSLFKKTGTKYNSIVKLLPVASAFIITCIGLVICYESLLQAGINFTFIFQNFEDDTLTLKSVTSLGVLGILTLGLVYGLKHATEPDHVVAVSAIVSEHKNLFKAASVGVLWGIGHTFSLIVVGLVVLGLKLAIPENIAGWLEFGVSLMIIWLGVNALLKALPKNQTLKNQSEPDIPSVNNPEPLNKENQSIFGWLFSQITIKPIIVGSIHGLAGSAALTLLVLTQIESAILGVAYLSVFGFGSILGMLLMSGLVGLPFVIGTKKAGNLSQGLQLLAGVISIIFGLWYAYETGIAKT